LGDSHGPASVDAAAMPTDRARDVLPIPDQRHVGLVTFGQLDIGEDDHDHLISPEERLKVAMARQ
jgi:hypothetical protein